jgi:hypothetical protein
LTGGSGKMQRFDVCFHINQSRQAGCNIVNGTPRRSKFTAELVMLGGRNYWSGVLRPVL